MRHPTAVRLAVPLVALGLLAAACGGGAPTGLTPDGERRLSATLNASGATFPQAFYEEAIGLYNEAQPGVVVNYGGGGSGKGRQELQDGVVDFAGSDALVKPADLPKFKGGELLYVPTIAAPITVSYNLRGVGGLRLDAPTLARIFQREVTRWDDPALKELNPAAPLPATPITVVHRSDGSGTTENFTRYLVKAAPEVWRLKSGSTVEWPADTQAGNGNTGVAQLVKAKQGAIGYVDLSDAKAAGLRQAEVRNRAGDFVKPTLEATSAALAGVTVNADLSYDPLDSPAPGAYPIAAPTWILVYRAQPDRAKGEALRSFLRFLLTRGHEIAAELDYAALPRDLRDRALAQVDLVSPAAAP